MKKTGIINRDVSALVARMGHYDGLLVTDAGFSAPAGVPCVDLSLLPGSPTVDEVLAIIAQELQVERFHFADEASALFPDRAKDVHAAFPNATAAPVPHGELKDLAKTARGMVRTGDTRAYANVLLVSGVIY